MLGDDPQAPQCMETVHRRGYRFIAPLTVAEQPMAVPEATAAVSVPPLISPHAVFKAPLLVGRDHEVQRLHVWLGQALGGTRQVAFVTGEAGIGKTTVVDAFVSNLTAMQYHSVARGQCLDHHSVGEAYLPVLSTQR
jgi:hypothetical protein